MIFGVDPGLKGAVVCMSLVNKEIVFYWTMDQWQEALEYAKALPDQDHIQFILEAAQPMPKQGVTSVFTYGQGFGRLIGWIEALDFPYQTVHPRIWTKAMLAGVPSDLEKKERNREAFKRLYGGTYKKILNRVGKPHDGIVDAALIARWGCKNAV